MVATREELAAALGAGAAARAALAADEDEAKEAVEKAMAETAAAVDGRKLAEERAAAAEAAEANAISLRDTAMVASKDATEARVVCVTTQAERCFKNRKGKLDKCDVHPTEWKELTELVCEHMQHSPCGRDDPKAACMQEDGTCKRQYPKPFLAETKKPDGKMAAAAAAAHRLHRQRDERHGA